MSARELEADLRAMGIECTVEAREKLAILIPAGDARRLSSADARLEAVRLAEAHGFTNLALEIGDEPPLDAGN